MIHGKQIPAGRQVLVWAQTNKGGVIIIHLHPSLLQKHNCGVTNGVYHVEPGEPFQVALDNFGPSDENVQLGNVVATA